MKVFSVNVSCLILLSLRTIREALLPFRVMVRIPWIQWVHRDRWTGQVKWAGWFNVLCSSWIYVIDDHLLTGEKFLIKLRKRRECLYTCTNRLNDDTNPGNVHISFFSRTVLSRCFFSFSFDYFKKLTKKIKMNFIYKCTYLYSLWHLWICICNKCACGMYIFFHS